ncbi:MAG: hypothetical protein A2V67_02005 [Deltaproteobacteria bacterium RBG_13_61_14]|nr:MAG: hypothetical protein A2V67_02005 [Deltaproteobacteria bacterium RBG_13_61_14]
MKELKWLDQYSGESVEELIALEGKYRIDSLVLAFEQALDQKEARAGANQITAEERVIQAIEALEREVNNGGYSQFFLNSSREYAPIIVEALTRISCPKTAEITRRAIAALGISGSFTEAAIAEVMEAESSEREEKLEQCDNEYFQSGESIETGLFQFIKTNRDKINLGISRSKPDR